jgi:peptidase E
MSADAPTIVASSIGMRPSERGPLDLQVGPIFRYLPELAQVPTGRDARICFVTTAVGDNPSTIAALYSAFSREPIRVSHLALFPMPTVDDIRGHLLGQDAVWVWGGSVANLLAVWRTHQLDAVLHECWQAGVVLGGVSAGSLCWHVGGTTDSFGPELRPFTNGLGFLPYSNGVHYDSEDQRRPLYHRLIGDGTLPDGWATDDGVALVYRGTELAEVVTDREDARAYAVRRADDGEVVEEPIEPRRLPD